MLKPMLRSPAVVHSVFAPPLTRPVTRRRALGFLGAGFALASLGGCDSRAKWRAIDVSGSSPPLEFSMTRASDGRRVTQADYRGQVVMLYFGYTYCPDVCPTTLLNVANILKRLGSDAQRIRVLFVTVDPNRDTLPVLADYVKNFAPEIEGLRGDPDELASLARRYRLVYSVTPETKDHPYEVTHASAIYIFDSSGAARLLVPSLNSPTQDMSGVADDLRRLADEANPPGWFARLLSLV